MIKISGATWIQTLVLLKALFVAVTLVGGNRRTSRLRILHPALKDRVFYDRYTAGDAELSHCVGFVDLDGLDA